MADFPDAITSPRTMANRPNVVYDSSKTKVIYAEDFNKDRAEIVAIETALGVDLENIITGDLSDCYDLPADAILAGTLPAGLITSDHGTATNPEIVSVVYGTSDTPPDADDTPIGTLYIKYTA
jgi:hypothetical protein